MKRANGNQALQLAAVEAVVREKGRVGLELVLGYQQASHWWEEERVAEKVRDMLLQNGAPRQGLLQSTKDLKVLRAWFDVHGAAYLSQRK
jgi:hypothetical protein